MDQARLWLKDSAVPKQEGILELGFLHWWKHEKTDVTWE